MSRPENLAALARSFLDDSANQTLAATGHQRLPSGLLIQWGLSLHRIGWRRVCYPSIPFSDLFVAVATPSTVASATPNSWGLDTGSTLTTLKFNNHSAITQGGFWIAIGT